MDNSRSGRLLRDYIVSFVPKVPTAMVLFVSVPLVASELDTTQLAHLALLVTSLAWISTFNPALGPFLSVSEARLNEQGSSTASLALLNIRVGLIAGLALSAIWVLLFITGTGRLDTLLLVCGVLLAVCAFSADALRIGRDRAYETSLISAASTSISIVALLVAAQWLDLSVTAAFGIMYILPLLLRSASLVKIGLRDKGEGAHELVARREVVELIRQNSLHMASQISVLTGYPLAVLLFERTGLDAMVGRLFVIQSLAITSIGIVQSSLTPLAARVSAAVEAGDSDWVRQITRHLAVIMVCLSTTASAVGYLLGPRLLAFAFDVALQPTPTELLIIGLSVGTVNLSVVLYNVLVGLGDQLGATLALVPGILFGVVAVLLAGRAGSTTLVAASVALVQPAAFIPILAWRLRGTVSTYSS